MPPFEFEKKPMNWTSFAKDLSILSPGFLPKNRILLKRYLQNPGDEVTLDADKPEEDNLYNDYDTTYNGSKT